mmetsp:Transcript_6729/g.9850  ORF Transcript_6729/g.9850 Transcript_6729/m.9850 type:complete len:126 (+) Transcript_6729:142-519(+)|eukprot:CAMPEP_0196810924 /NCGR_PEP_ID=MMETSP1362-20130617/15451_1 /TAXON_ID=163516 /ORGANISM="Leptocylindrus danicus, Strain CCMP1856" /LENGTH=125 /DNA_ID=CAMNT_0042186119 /DNA_START=142 /DNA_END=519 /DNA_ORIENTATION=-
MHCSLLRIKFENEQITTTANGNQRPYLFPSSKDTLSLRIGDLDIGVGRDTDDSYAKRKGKSSRDDNQQRVCAAVSQPILPELTTLEVLNLMRVHIVGRGKSPLCCVHDAWLVEVAEGVHADNRRR